MTVINKIEQARQHIKQSSLKKSGYNDYSKYYYFTPEQVNKLVNEACQAVGLFNKFQLKRTELGLVAVIEVIDLELDENEVFEMATAIPEIKATNIAQQLGGAVTYSQRYLLMTIYDIVDNNLDFDTPQKQVAEQVIWMTEQEKNQLLQIAETDPERAKRGLKYWTSEGRNMKKEWKEELKKAIQ